MLDNDCRIVVYTAGKMRRYRIRSIVGARVHVELHCREGAPPSRRDREEPPTDPVGVSKSLSRLELLRRSHTRLIELPKWMREKVRTRGR
jgi:translation initiation factor IF-1